MTSQFLIKTDQAAFLWLNGLHCGWLDEVMFALTSFLVWIPLFLLLLYLLVRTYKRKIFMVLLGVALLITAADQSANLAKRSVKRLRPTHEPELAGKVHMVNGYKGGLYSFFSGHATNTFALAVFLSLLLRRRFRWITPVLLGWAMVMSYTRIYLGVHYPADILVGAFTGSILGWLFALIMFEFPGMKAIATGQD